MKGFNSQTFPTQVEKGEQLVAMLPSVQKAFVLMGDVYSGVFYRRRNVEK